MTECIGDLLLAFQQTEPHCTARFDGQPWQLLKENSGWRLWQNAPVPLWKGYPLCISYSADWWVGMLGELFEPCQEKMLDSIPDGPYGLQEVVQKMNGHFLILAWEVRTNLWHVWTDRFSTLHAYYAFDGRRAALGTFSPSVAATASNRRLDWEGLSGFFAYGFFPGDRTHFDDVQILRPATHYFFNANGQLRGSQRYWSWTHTVDNRRSYDDTVKEFANVFGRVNADQTRDGRVAIPISGGLDSRSTVTALTCTGQKPEERFWAYSYGYTDDSRETHIARQVAKTRDLPFKAYTISPYLFERLDDIMAWTEGFQDITMARQAFVRDDIARNADRLVAALWGDVWLDNMGLAGQHGESLSVKNIEEHAIRKMTKRGGSWLVENISAPQLGGLRAQEILQSMVTQEFGQLSNIADPDFRIKAYKTDQWSFRWSMPPIRIFQSAAAPCLVFYDTRIADFFCTVPSDFISKRLLQIDYLKRFSPDLARIRWQVYDANLFRYHHFNTWLLPRRAMLKAGRMLTGKNIIERNWEVQFFDQSGRRDLEVHLCRKGLRLHEFVSPVSLQKLLAAFYRSPLEMGRGYTISMLLTFSAWLERYA